MMMIYRKYYSVWRLLPGGIDRCGLVSPWTAPVCMPMCMQSWFPPWAASNSQKPAYDAFKVDWIVTGENPLSSIDASNYTARTGVSFGYVFSPVSNVFRHFFRFQGLW